MPRLRAVPAIAALICAVSWAPAAAAEPPPGADAVDRYPVADGVYTSPDDYGWLFFTAPGDRACGIGPNGGPVGCDAVPMDAPEGSNQTVVRPGAPAEYVGSETPTFTRENVDALPEGHQLVNFGASCAVGFQGTVTCKTYGAHGFTIASSYGVLW